MFAVLHIADFALHAVLRTESEAAHKPAALFAGTSKKSVVLAANPAARGAGVELGMTAPQAVARCATLLIRSPRADAEAEARAALLAIGFTLSPSIEDTAPGVCTLDLRGRTHEQVAAAAEPDSHAPPSAPANGVMSAVIAATAQLTALGLPATAGIARTPLLALYAARAERVDSHALSQPSSANPRVADNALRLEESPAVYFTPPGERGVLLVTSEKNFLASLPLAAADPSPELATVLDSWGLHTLGDLTALPRDEIVRRFSAAGLALWRRAAGGDPRPLHPVAPAQTFSAAMEFEQAIETLEPLLFILRRFLDRLTLELRASQHVAAELHFTLRLEDDTRHARSFRLPEPTADTGILFRTLHTHLESLATAAAIVALELSLTPTRPLVRQQGLFETSLRDPHGFSETLARVSASVGSDRVGTPHLENTHRPDAVKLAPPLAVIAPSVAIPLHPPFSLPLRRFRPPLPARLGEEGARTYVWSERIRGEIAFQSPAFFTDGDWWQTDRRWNRIEWDIALVEGGLYRLLQIGEAWFIEGEYD